MGLKRYNESEKGSVSERRARHQLQVRYRQVSPGRSQYMKTYSKPTLKKHSTLSQITFSSH